jgi:hypothetical protein
MDGLVSELKALTSGVFDGEFVAFDDGIPWFADVCGWLLNGDRRIRLTYVAAARRGRAGRRSGSPPSGS